MNPRPSAQRRGQRSTLTAFGNVLGADIGPALPTSDSMTEVPLTSAAHNVAETYVTTQGFYAAIYDEASPANVKDFLKREFEAAEEQIAARGVEHCFTLFAFNQRLMDRAG